jgi:8-amino-7-oxononanoate synthase
MADIFDKCEQFFTSPRGLGEEDQALAARLFARVSPAANSGPWMEVDGRRFLQFSSNDYLGLAGHPAIRTRAAELAEQYGIYSPMGSRMMTGTTDLHLELERKLAVFKRCEAALAFATGSFAMMGVLAALAGPRDVLVMDEHAHASLVCGAKISGARMVIFRHNDVAHLESVLQQIPDEVARSIVVDGVYSMQGDIAPLQEIVALKKKYDARLIVDDAHGTGVFGENGRGVASHLGVEEDVDLHLGTFSKALGTIGGFAAGDGMVIEYLRYHAPTFVFTKSLPLVVVGATLVSLDLLQKADDARARSWENARYLQGRLQECGMGVGRTQSPITPIQVEDDSAFYLAEKLHNDACIWVVPVVYPAVPMGKSILRVIPTALHQRQDLDYLVESLMTVKGSVVIGSMPIV